MIELFVNCAVVAVIAVPVLIVMYLVKDAGEEAIREYAEELRAGNACTSEVPRYAAARKGEMK